VNKLTINQIFGYRVRELRLARGWSQEEFGAQCLIDRTYVSGVERGVRNPTLTVISSIAAGLNVPIESLFTSDKSA
jgi:transcriptional regulator with XRE-family HTH domain